MEIATPTVSDMQLFNSIINHIKKKIINCSHTFFGNVYDAEKTEILELIQRSVEMGESNSAILCGPPGCGKTALLNNVIKELSDDKILTSENSVIVRLNGLIHTDDRLTLQDIARQLKLADFSEEAVNSKSFQENLAFILEQLQRNAAQKPCVVFILDDFHLFAEHKNQLLLYNLFDTAQAAKSPICVIGLTYYSDVMDLLEKRVLSRFSHRIIQMAKTVSIEERLALLKNLFTLTENELPGADEIYVWNKKTDQMVECPAVRRVLQQHLDLDSSEATLRSLFLKLLCNASFEEPLLTVPRITQVFTPKDDPVLLLSRLSALEVALVVAIKHHSQRFEREPFNFEMILKEYMKFVKEHASTMVSERAVIFKAFQRLQELQFVVPAKRGTGSGSGRVPMEYQLFSFSMTDDQVAQGVKLNPGVSADLSQWGSNDGI